MLRRKRRYIVNDERRACVDRCESALSSPLLRYLVRLRNCSDAQRDILALLIFEQPVHLKKTIDELYSMGMIPMVVQCLTTDNINDLLRWCACRIIARIISHDNVEHINELNRCNFLANIVPSIDTENDEQYNCVCKIIASIIHKDNVIYPTFRLELLVNLVNTFARTLKSKTGDLINDIIRVMIDRSEFNGVWSEAILPQIFRMIQSNQMVEMNLRLLSSLTDGYGFHDRSEKIVQYRFIPELVKLISWPLAIQLVTLKVIKNISKGYDEHIFDLLNANLLVPLKEILQKSNLKILRHLTLDILSNISGGHRTDVLALINAGFVPIVLDIMHTGDNKSQLFATWIINNITNRGNIDDIKFIIECGALGVLCKMLPMPDNDIIIVSRKIVAYGAYVFYRRNKTHSF